MSDIKKIIERNERRKHLIAVGAAANSNEFVEQVYELKEINRLTTADFDYLITTIESQKEEIERWKINSSEYENLLNRQIESLKAITELAVKTLNDVIEENFPSFPPGRTHFIRERLLEIEQLGGVRT